MEVRHNYEPQGHLNDDDGEKLVDTESGGRQAWGIESMGDVSLNR